jgi:nitrate/TMAO reductase-like tetraheme cytochrome c subunit
MRITDLFGRRVALVSAGLVMVILIGGIVAFEPVTRNLVASEFVCSYCHAEREYVPAARRSFSIPHPAPPEVEEVEAEEAEVEGAEAGKEMAQCVDCHLPEGFLGSAYMYTHIASATDLFGFFRDRESERTGDWIPPSAARAFRMRDRLFEYDSVTCRTCHIEAEIKPKRKRGQKAHAKALENRETCIECHDNMVHRYVEVRKHAFQKPDAATE